jgi:AcrR family transcriptional regulator
VDPRQHPPHRRSLHAGVRLIQAATELFIERGYAATTLADIAVQAGLAPRAVYLRFATKADLLQRYIGLAH